MGVLFSVWMVEQYFFVLKNVLKNNWFGNINLLKIAKILYLILSIVK